MKAHVNTRCQVPIVDVGEISRLPKWLRGLVRSALAALAVSCLAAGPTAAAAPVIALQDDVLPTLTDPAQITTRLDQLAATGVKVTRVDVVWSQVAPRKPADPRNPADPAYDWSRYDTLLKGLKARNIGTLLDFYHTPSWASRAKKPASNDAPRVADAAPFAAAIARRYSGTFPDPAGGVLPEVRRIEVWNEPNIDTFFEAQCRKSGANWAYDSPRAYAALLAVAYREIKRANPRAIVVGGVAGPTAAISCPGRDRRVPSDATFADLVVRERPPMDAWSQHLYPIGSPRTAYFVPSWSSIPRIARALDKLRPGIPIYVTETGYHTSYNRFHRYFVSEAQQAAWVDETFEQAARYPRVEMATWFNLQDNPFWTGGLVRGDGTRKPSYDRFVAAAQAGGAAPPSWSATPPN
jgi:Cellulase (glycosyl hydrolase family 5)